MRGRPSLLVAVLVGAMLAGCAANVAPEPDASRPQPRPCEHPWPCGDGSEWPSQLVAAHPRQPAEIPVDLAPADAEIVERTATRAAFRWTVPTVDAAGGTLARPIDTLAPEVAFALPVPDGLFLTWTVAIELPPDTDGRSYVLWLYDADGKVVCATDHDLLVQGQTVEPGAEENNVSTCGPTAPFAAVATHSLVLRHEQDRAGSKIGLLVTMEVAPPQLALEPMPVEPLRVPMRDGTELAGAIWRPRLPEGVRAPIVLHTTPYVGMCSGQSLFRNCGPTIESETLLGDYGSRELLADGYAIALFSVRGTGASGGCYDAWGAAEQEDHLELVEWLASQAWSNGRVGMAGISYSGTTPLEAAIMQAPALKAIVVGGIISDVYLGGFTPQGAANDGSVFFHTLTTAGNSFVPARDDDALDDYLAVAGERACPGTERQLVAHQEAAFTDARDAAWFAERRLIDRFAGVTAATLLLQGVEDDNFHRYQDDIVWDALPNAPKGIVNGQWDHTIDLEPFLTSYDGPRSWYGMSKAWFDYWLKGLGEPPAELDAVSYQDSAMDWRATSAWPPPEARFETIYLADGALATEAGSGGATFRATRSPMALTPRTGNADWCGGDPNPTASGDDARWTTFASEPLDADVLVAGNAWAYLEISSDQPGGVVALDLYALDPNGACIEPLTDGAADLRFHDGVMAGHDFPTGTPTPVRVDLHSAATLVPAGSRLLVVISGGGYDYKQGQLQYEPQISLGGASHLVLPLVEGTLGGAAPTIEYPPRPFAPAPR